MGKKSNFGHIKDIIKNSINNRAIKESFRIFLLKKAWKQIIGEKLYLYTAPQKIFKTKLYVKCGHQGWIQTLAFYKKDLIETINNKFKDDFEINDIIFVFGKMAKDDFIEKQEILQNNTENKENYENYPKNNDINELLKEYFKNCDRKTGQTKT